MRILHSGHLCTFNLLETIYLDLDKECRLRTLRVNESQNTLNIFGIFGNQGGIADLFVPF